MDTRSRVSIKVDALQRLLMVNLLAAKLRLYTVTEYPKSGGTWLAQMLSDYLNVPFPRNQRPQLQSCVMHGHYLWTPLMSNVVCLFRDGRDIMVSAYYHMLFPNERNSPLLVEKTRRVLQFSDLHDIENNLPRFIEYMFEENRKGLFRFNWREFVESWSARDNVVSLKYEELLKGAATALRRPVELLTHQAADFKKLHDIQARYSFQQLANREAGVEATSSFLRKGIAGDWKTRFNREARQAFNHYAGDCLIQLGYAPDSSWVAE